MQLPPDPSSKLSHQLPDKLPLAPLRRRLLSMAYEGVLLFAILFIASYLFLSLARSAESGWPRHIYQIYLVAVCGVYFVFCWTRSGQTLPMKTWRMRVVTDAGRSLSVGRALRRYLLAVPGVLCGVGLLWSLFDRERQFLHDRLAGTRIVRTDADPQTLNSER